MVKPYDHLQGQGHVFWPTVVASLMLIDCLVPESIQGCNFAFADSLRPCIKVKVMETSMGIYVIHKSTGMPSFNVIA